ncbi:MAG: glycoside hydrolase family 88 protein [Bacteroidales bacterium]|nr:glycoside hydrolase family 88 protein [Bacteroidales bacterium]
MRIYSTLILNRLSLIIAGVLLITPARSQSLPEKSEIISAMRLVNGFWMQGHPDPGNNQWARAAYFTGNMDFYKIYPKEAYLDYAGLWATNNNWSLNGGVTTRNADNQTAGQVYIDLYLLDTAGNDYKISQISECIGRMVNSTKSDDWWWIDALYMAMPVFTRLGILLNDEDYFLKMDTLYRDTKYRRGLYNGETGLWYRDESFDPPYTTPNGKDCYWSRGNGWVFAAHARVLQLLPESHLTRDEYVETFRKMAGALKERQRGDGFWDVSLDDPDDFGGPETSGTAFFTYGMAWGINNGFLDSASYYPVVVSAWNGLTSVAVHEDGFLGYVQGVGSSPASSQPVTFETTADFGVGAFLLAGSEVVKLAGGEMPEPSPFYVDSVLVQDEMHLEVFFSDTLDEASAVNVSNYTIGMVTVLEAVISESRKSVILTLSGIPFGKHQLTLENIFSSSGYPLEPGTSITFSWIGNIIISASSYEPGTSNVPENTMDFDLGTRWSAQGMGEWIRYDLGEVKTVTSVDIAFYRGNERKAFFSISLSEDDISYTEQFNGESGGTTLELQNFDFEDQDARYVKITGYGNSTSDWNSITEVRINTVSGDTTGFFRSGEMKEQSITVYPNPSGTLFNIETEGEFTCQLYDMKGFLISEENPMDRCALGEELPTGTYILKIFQERFSGSLHIIKL